MYMYAGTYAYTQKKRKEAWGLRMVAFQAACRTGAEAQHSIRSKLVNHFQET